MTHTPPPPSARAEFEALMAELQAAYAEVNIAYGWGDRHRVNRYNQACEQMALHILHYHAAALDNEPPEPERLRLPERWQYWCDVNEE